MIAKLGDPLLSDVLWCLSCDCVQLSFRLALYAAKCIYCNETTISTTLQKLSKSYVFLQLSVLKWRRIPSDSSGIRDDHTCLFPDVGQDTWQLWTMDWVVCLADFDRDATKRLSMLFCVKLEHGRFVLTRWTDHLSRSLVKSTSFLNVQPVDSRWLVYTGRTCVFSYWICYFMKIVIKVHRWLPSCMASDILHLLRKLILPKCLPVCKLRAFGQSGVILNTTRDLQKDREGPDMTKQDRKGSQTAAKDLVQCCTLYGNATDIANTRYRTCLSKISENWVRTSYNQIKSAVR